MSLEFTFEINNNVEFKEKTGVISPGVIVVSDDDVISEVMSQNLVLHQFEEVKMLTTLPRRAVDLYQKGGFLGLDLCSGLAQTGINIKSLSVDSLTAKASLVLENLNPDLLTLRSGEQIKMGRPYVRSDKMLAEEEIAKVKAGIKCFHQDCIEIIKLPDVSSDLLLAIPLARRILPQEHSSVQVNLATLPRGTQRRELHARMGLDIHRKQHDFYFDNHYLSLAATDKLTLPKGIDLFIMGVRNKNTEAVFSHGASPLLFSQDPGGKIYHHERIVEILAPSSYLLTEDINNFQVLCLAYRHQVL